MKMTNSDILKYFDYRAIVKENFLHIEVIEKRNPIVKYKIILQNSNKILDKLKDNNFSMLYLLSFIYKENVNLIKAGKLTENVTEMCKILKAVYGDDWVYCSELLVNDLDYYNSVKVSVSVVELSVKNHDINFKIVVKHKGKQFTFYRVTDLLDEDNRRNSENNLNKVYTEILLELKDIQIGNRKETDLFKKYRSLLNNRLGKYIEYGLMDVILNKKNGK